MIFPPYNPYLTSQQILLVYLQETPQIRPLLTISATNPLAQATVILVWTFAAS